MHHFLGRLICALFVLAGASPAFAGTDLHATSSLASAHCNEVVAANVSAQCASMVDRALGSSYCISQMGSKRFQEQGTCIDSNPANGTASPYTFSAAQLNFHTWTTNDCPARSEVFNWYYDPAVAGGKVCDNGCEYDGGVNVEDGTTSHIPNGNTCGTNSTDAPPPTTDPDSDGDGVTDQDDDFPNDPGETTDSDGDGVGDNGDTAPEDPTNGSDDGTGDNEDDNQASGGGVCGSSPPACVGDGIACAILYQAYKGRCATENQWGVLNDIKDGILDLDNGGAGPVGEWDPEGTTNGLLSEIKGLAQDIKEMLHGDGEDAVPDLSGFTVPEEELPSELPEWDSGVGGAAACPAPITTTIELGAYSTELSLSLDPLCELASAIYLIIMACAAVTAGYIVVTGARM